MLEYIQHDTLFFMEKPAQHIVRNNLLALLTTAVLLGLAAKLID